MPKLAQYFVNRNENIQKSSKVYKPFQTRLQFRYQFILRYRLNSLCLIALRRKIFTGYFSFMQFWRGSLCKTGSLTLAIYLILHPEEAFPLWAVPLFLSLTYFFYQLVFPRTPFSYAQQLVLGSHQIAFVILVLQPF